MEVLGNNYEIVSRLSAEKSTRFGSCFLIKPRDNTQLFVLKTVEKSNSIGYAQLKNESQFTFKINGLPEIISAIETESSFSIIKKYEQGIGLNEFWHKVKRKDKLSKIKALIEALTPLFDALEKQKIVHSDIKPENIVVQNSEGKLTCSLIDFGLAFHLEEIPERKTLFQLAYAPPEFILNRLNCADFSSDVFSFCLILYSLLNGKLPFTHSNPAILTQLQITYPIEKPFKIKRKVWTILEKGLQKHQFRKSPKHYSKDELDSFLRKTNATRFQYFREFAVEWNKI